MGEIRDGYFRSRDGLLIYFREHLVPDAKAQVILVHGVAEHYGRYRDFERFLAERGYGLSMIDQRGHGQSEGKRVYTPAFDNYLDDQDLVVEHVKTHAKKIFMVGHSLGGVVALRYVQTRQPEFLGLATSGAALEATVQPPKPVFKVLERVNKLYDATPVPGLVKPEQICRDPAIVERYKRDPLVTKYMTTQFGLVVLDACKDAFAEAGKIRIPALVMHGEGDSVAAPSGSREIHRQIASEDKQLRLYPKLYHEIFNEPERETVLADLTSWMDDRL